MFTCEFVLASGIRIFESDIPGGWREFTEKKSVKAVVLYNRQIDTSYLQNAPIAGFAIHWIGVSIDGKDDPHYQREVMMVLPNKKVYVCNLDKNGRWTDYMDDLVHPRSAHLQNYNLKIHGIRL